jgi:hypothetical protein
MSEQIVYPGHPVFLALQIMDAFPSFERAAAKDNGEFNNAVSSDRVNGSGGAVHSAMRLLEFAKQGINPEQVFQYGVETWASARGWGTVGCDFASNYEAGILQAERLKDEFISRLAQWSKQ